MSSGAAGVVRSLVSVPMFDPFQEIARANSPTIVVTLVLPLVPVTPTNSQRSCGLPVTSEEACATSPRSNEGATVITGTSSCNSSVVTTHTAPLAIASLTYFAPFSAVPVIAKNTDPGVQLRESNSTFVTSMLAVRASNEKSSKMSPSCITSRPMKSLRPCR